MTNSEILVFAVIIVLMFSMSAVLMIFSEITESSPKLLDACPNCYGPIYRERITPEKVEYMCPTCKWYVIFVRENGRWRKLK